MSVGESALPVYSGRELHIHISGSIAACLTPWWIHLIRHLNPQVVVHASVSSAASRFVSLEAVRELANGNVWLDRWDEPALPSSWRLGRSGNSECMLILPASLDTVMRLSQGRSDTPALLMLQATRLPIVIADVFPADNAVIAHWMSIVKKRPNIHFVPRVEASRAEDRSQVANGFNVPGAFHIANSLLLAGRE